MQMSINKNILSTGIFADGIVTEEEKLRIVISNASLSNVITVKAKLNNQDDFDLLQTITGNAKLSINIKTYDLVELECTTYGSLSDHVKVVAGSFKLAGGTTTLGAPTGGIVEADPIELTSADNSMVITANEALSTIDFSVVRWITPKYVQTFNNTTDWTLNGSYYQLTVLSATHVKTNPVVETFETVGGIDTLINVDIIRNSTNDIILQVTQTPDNRYTGKVVIL
jgi:hypothetical protein